MTLLENRGSDGSLISSYRYTLDTAGNRTKVEEEPGGRVVDYVYDATDRLLSESISEPGKENRVLSYTYDKVGNRLSKTENGFTTTYTYDNNNRLIKEDDVTYSYDDNGNLTAKQSAEEQIVYAYNYDNHLTRVETTRYGATIVVEYEYDAEGNRIRKTIDNNVVINYLVDTNRDYAQVLEERDGDGNLLVRYVYGHDLISQTRPSAGSGSVTSYYHYDGLGSTRALSSSAGIVTDSYSYDAFGLLLEQTGTTENHYRYRGEQFDEELGFYYLRARYMDPNVGRFVTMDAFAGLSQDPVTLHKYLYANANPMTYSDPSGYFSVVEVQMACAIRGVLSGVQTDIGMAIFDQVRYGKNSALESIFMGAGIAVGIPAAITIGGELIGYAFKLVPDKAWELIERFRKKAKSLRQLGDNIPVKGDNLGTVAVVKINRRFFCGVNSKALLDDKSKDLGREFFKFMKSKGFLKGAKHYGDGAAQVLTHAETHSLMRAWKRTGGNLGEQVTVFVDRLTCGNCRTYLKEVKEAMNIKELTVVTKGGRTFKF